MAIQGLSGLRERFEAKYLPEPNSGCWLWEGATDNAGYGDFCVSGRKSHRRAHIVSFLLAGNEIPAGKHVLHKCGVKGCVNPQHLYAGNQSQNMTDAKRAGRLLYNPKQAKLAGKPELCQQIAELSRTKRYSQVQLGKLFGMSQTSISRAIKAGKKD